jgi:transposase
MGEREGAKLVLAKAATQPLPRLVNILADGGDTGDKMKAEAARYGWGFETVKRPEMHKFEVIPKRRVVERSIGWTMHWRSLCRQYDYDSRTTETKIVLTSLYYMTKRITKTT